MTVWAIRSEAMASSAEITGSLAASMMASSSCLATSLRMRRTISRVASVPAAAPISDRPRVKGAAAWAAMISAARIASCVITAIFMPMTRAAAASRVKAMTSAAWRASSK
ncbi:hypothetical protein DMH18_28390 [Streptomyces sp. WAC 06783]|nr:hypothetical protein DMH18_28390 [Streptomyces sp. WAC 06783]